MDFESRSTVDLKKTGSWRYSLHPTTEILCLVFRLPYWPKGQTALYHPAFPSLGIPEGRNLDKLPELFQWITEGELVEAHNAFFERGMWQNIMVSRYGWPMVAPSQWRCSAAKAAALSLPRKLGEAAKVLRLKIQKDPEGMKKMKESAIKRMFKPRKPRKKERELWTLEHGSEPMPPLWWESLEWLEGMWAYCALDVLAEEALSNRLPNLSPEETELYLMDQTINERGFQLDQEAVESALELIEQETALLNAELFKLTKGKVERATQRDRMIDWFADQGYEIPNTQAETLDIALGLAKDMLGDLQDASKLPRRVRRGLELMRTLGRSSTAKYDTMRLWACPDWRVRGGLLFHGASTGRWSGKGVQPHNFVKGNIKDIEATWNVLKTRDRTQITQFAFDGKAPANDVMKPLSHALRGAIVASAGKNLYVADFAAIEARVLLWMAQDEEALEIFRSGRDIYMEMASSIYGYPVTDKDKQKTERALGKVAILGLGYQMGWSKFIDTCWTMAQIIIEEELSKQTVDAYRAKFWLVKQMWTDQEEGAITAVLNKYKKFTVGRVTWVYEDMFLYCILPSGRRLAYPYPKIASRATPWGEQRQVLTFMGVNPVTKQWQSQTTYGGSIVENIVQAVARDLMAYGMMLAEQTGVYQIILTVHDEMIAEANAFWASVEEFERLMAKVPEWGEGCPVTAEGWTGKRYRK